MNRIILHIDMNSYFASVEQQANPHLRGRPVGVCEHLGGIIIAPSVEAKRLGIKLGTPVWEARKIYPGIVLLPVDPDKIRHVTAAFLKILADYSDDVEKYSIDEAFVDITKTCGGSYDDALLIGLEIKQRLRLEVGEWVSCSIGVGPNKLIAKLAAELDGGAMSVIATPSSARGKQSINHKIASSAAPPEADGLLAMTENKAGARDDSSFLDRICVIRLEEIPSLYERLKLTDIPGIGYRLERALNKLGIFTLRELAEYPLENLLNQFGIFGYQLHCMGRFDSLLTMTPTYSPSRGGEPVKSFGHSYTVAKAIREIREIRQLMYKLAEKVGRRMRRKGARGNIVHYFHSGPSHAVIASGAKRSHEIATRPAGARDDIFYGKQHKIGEYINDGREIYRAAWGIYSSCHSESRFRSGRRISRDPSERSAPQDDNVGGIKIMGISVSGLIFNHQEEYLFENYKRPVWLVNAMDRINDKYGEFTIRRGRLIKIPPQWGKDTIGFGRMKEF